jgi:hypothetical protein
MDMEDLINMAINLHLIFIVAMVLLGALNLLFIYTSDSFFGFTKKIKFVSPQYYMMLASIFFTGLIVLGVSQFRFSFEIFLMIVAWFVIFIMSIKSFKIFKRTTKEGKIAKEAYKKFVIKKYSIDIILLILVGIYSYMW